MQAVTRSNSSSSSTALEQLGEILREAAVPSLLSLRLERYAAAVANPKQIIQEGIGVDPKQLGTLPERRQPSHPHSSQPYKAAAPLSGMAKGLQI